MQRAEHYNMLFVFVVAIIVTALTCTVYVLNEKKIHYHISELNNIKLIEKKLLAYKDSNSATFELPKNLVPSCMGAYILNKNLDTIVWKSTHSTVVLDPSLLDSQTKQIMTVRALTGGGILRLPWRQRTPNGSLKEVTASVVLIEQDKIGVVVICD